MHYISWKNLVIDTFFFLLQPLELLYPLSLNRQKREKCFFRKRLIIIHRFVLNNSIPFIWENKKWIKFRIFIIAAHRTRTMLQCNYALVYLHCYVQGVDQKCFWTWIKILTFLLYRDSIFTIQDFVFWKKCSMFWYILWRIASEGPP